MLVCPYLCVYPTKSIWTNRLQFWKKQNSIEQFHEQFYQK
jgi:hypothetical protein